MQIMAAVAEYLRDISLESLNKSDTHISVLSGHARVTLKIPLDVVASNLHVCV